MYTFDLIDAQILLGLSCADRGSDISCQTLVASCATGKNRLPTLLEFSSAFNKLLYISAITLDNDKIMFSNFGRDLINNARRNAKPDAHADELASQIFTELASYKLKSMCNRKVWSEEQYQQAIDGLQQNN